MKREEYARLQAVFEEAVELAGEARRASLDRACAGDETLRRRVERLLARDADESGPDLEARGGLGTDLFDAVRAEAEAPLGHARKIGRYRIERKIAEGGMGTVYLAEQDHPRRQVALKVIRAGVVTEELRRRFEVEAELLGRLQHPGIAQIYEAGEAETDDGSLPYFAMEYIDGVELRRYVEEHELGVSSRLELLAALCDAVSHAHQKGIVHRDLKPGNVLVVEETTVSTAGASGTALRGRPVVLDFGVSRVVREGAPDATKLTQTGHVLGTLAYMSPEQAGGEQDVDTRSDVYSLGVIGFELVSGRLPRDFADVRLLRALRTIQEHAAPRLDSVDRRFRGDLAIIIGKALEIEPERRYASAAALAEDLRRYLADQPINARPPTIGYQLGRFVRRNRLLVSAGVIAVTALVLALVLALRAREQEATHRRLAEQRTEETRRTAYAAQIQAANAFLVGEDAAAARLQLSSCDPELRGWEWEYLAHRAEDDLATVAMTVPPKPFAPTTPGEAHVLLPIDDETLHLFDLTTTQGHDVTFLDPILHDAHVIALLPGHTAALIGHEDGRLVHVDLTGDRAPHPVWTGEHLISWLEVSPDGRHLAVVLRRLSPPPSTEATLYLLDLESFEERARREGLPRIYDLAFPPGEGPLAAATGSGDVLLFDPVTLEDNGVRRGHFGGVLTIAYSPSGKEFASAGFDRTVRVWDGEREHARLVLGPGRFTAEALAFTPDGKTLLTGHADARVRFWDLTTGTCTRLTSQGRTAEPEESVVHQIMIHGERVFACGLDGVHVRALHDAPPDLLSHSLGEHSYAYGVEFDPSSSGARLASAGWDGFVRLWDVDSRTAIAKLACPENTQWAKYVDEGRALLTSAQTGYTEHVLERWDMVALRRERSLEYGSRRPTGMLVPASEAFLLSNTVTDIIDENFVPVVHELWILDPTSLTVRDKREVPAEIWAFALSPDGSRFAYGMTNGELVLGDARTLESSRVWRAHENAVEALAFSPDGARLASGGLDEEVRVWYVSSGRELLHFETPGARNVFALVYSPDGRRLFSGSRRVSIGIWDAHSGLELLRLHGHDDYVHDLQLSPDGRILASASGDGTVRLWDARPLAERDASRRRVRTTEDEVRATVHRMLAELATREEVRAAIAAEPGWDRIERHAAENVALRAWSSD